MENENSSKSSLLDELHEETTPPALAAEFDRVDQQLIAALKQPAEGEPPVGSSRSRRRNALHLQGEDQKTAAHVAAKEAAKAPKPPKEEPPKEKQVAGFGEKTVSNELPADAIEQLSMHYAGSGELVRVCVKRRSPAGQWSAVGRDFYVPPHQLTNLPMFVHQYAGGGTFIFEVLDLKKRVRIKEVPRWEERFEGQPRLPPQGTTILYNANEDSLYIGVETDTGAGFSGIPASPHGVPTVFQPAPWNQNAQAPQPAGPPVPQPTYNHRQELQPPPAEFLEQLGIGKAFSGGGYNAEILWRMVQDTYKSRYGRDPFQQQLDQANRDRENARVDAVHERTTREADTRLWQQQIESERVRSNALEREIERLRAAQERSAIENKLAALEARLSHPQAPQRSPLESLAALAPFVPVLVAWVESNSKSDKNSQSQMVELMKVIGSQKQADPLASLAPIMAAVAPLLAPALKAWVENQDPEKQMAVANERGMMHLNTVKMISDLILATQPQGAERPWWQDAVMQLLQEVGGGFRAMQLSGAASRALPQPQHQQQPMQQSHHVDIVPASEAAPPPVVAQQQPNSSNINVEATIARLAQVNPEAANYTAMVFRAIAESPFASPLFFTYEWITLVFQLHTKMDAAEWAEKLVDYLMHLQDYQMLPEVLEQSFTAPEDTVGVIIRGMPIYLVIDKDYAETVIQAVIAEMEERQSDEEEDDDSVEGEEDEEALEPSEDEDENASKTVDGAVAHA